MANRWILFIKNYAKENNISYTCAMCEIKTKNLYKPLKKEAIKEEPKIITIKTKKTNPKRKEEKENLIKIDKVRQKLNDEKKQILNDIEKILKRPKRRKAALLEPEITDKKTEEISALNYAKKKIRNKRNYISTMFKKHRGTYKRIRRTIERKKHGKF